MKKSETLLVFALEFEWGGFPMYKRGVGEYFKWWDSRGIYSFFFSSRIKEAFTSSYRRLSD